MKDTTRIRKFYLRGGEITVMIYFSSGYDMWIGRVQTGLFTPETTLTSAHSDIKKIPGLLRLEIARSMNPNVKKVDSRLKNDHLFGIDDEAYKQFRDTVSKGMGIASNKLFGK